MVIGTPDSIEKPYLGCKRKKKSPGKIEPEAKKRGQGDRSIG